MDYKRFISYLYSYIEGKKGVNVGYIRCEQRQGICRFTLNIQDRHGVEDGRYKVYLYKMTEEGVPIGYYLDDVVLHRFGGDMRKQTNSQNVWNTGNRIEDFDGVIAIYDVNHIYVSQWTDEAVNTYRFITWQDWSKKKPSSSGKVEIKTAYTDSLQAENEKADSAQEASFSAGKVELNPTQEASFSTGKAEQNPAQEAMLSAGKGEVNPAQEASFSAGNAEMKAAQVNPVLTEKAEQEIEADAYMLHGGDSDSESEGTVRQTETIGKSTPKTEKKTPTISNLTIRLMENRPKLPDFENHEIYDCVRIEPNDIGLLEMENWRLGVNSFLTHGFYNYKYLMLGKLRFQDGAVKAVLGVPGVYDNKEQYIAKIFGFEVFVPVKHTNTKTGNFGYWIVELV